MISLCSSAKPPFGTLVEPLLRELNSSARALTPDPATAEDLVQEALLKAYRAYDRFETGTNFRAWLHRILYNTFVSEFRRRRDHNEQPLTEASDAEHAPAAPDLTSNDLAQVGESIEDKLKHAIGRMNPEFREVFVRSALDDATNEEIAAALKIPVGTVMSRMHRARTFLKDELAKN